MLHRSQVRILVKYTYSVYPKLQFPKCYNPQSRHEHRFSTNSLHNSRA